MRTSAIHIDDFLLGIAEATNALISEDLDLGVRKALEVLGEHLKAGASFVFTNHKNDVGEQVSSIKYFWVEKNSNFNPVNNVNIPFESFGKILQILASGKNYELVFSESSERFRQLMQADGTKSLLLFPVFVKQTFWGFLGISEYKFEREWQVSEKMLLQSFANSIGMAVSRNLLEKNLEQIVHERTKELEESQQRLKLAIEGSQDGIWDWEPLKDVRYCSPRLYELIGYTEGEFNAEHSTFMSLIHPRDYSRVKENLDLHLRLRKPLRAEFRLLTKSGEYKWFRAMGQAMWNDRGEAIRIVGSLEDIHDHKTANDLLRSSEERFRSMVEHNPGALFLVNKEAEIVHYSHRARELFGYSHEELIHKKIHELLPDEIKSNYENSFLSFLNNPRSLVLGSDMNVRALRKDGSTFSIELGLSSVRIHNEVFVLVLVTDTSEERKAKLALEESHRQMKTLVNNLPGIVYRCQNNHNWSMDYISAACEEITGYPQEYFLGSEQTGGLAKIIHADDQQDVWEQVQEALKQKKVFRVIYRIISKDQKVKWIWEQGSGVFKKNGQTNYLEGCMFDISPLVRNQERVKSAIYYAEDQERKRIAAEIHDGLQQTLGISALNLQYLESEIERFSDEAKTRFFKSKKFLEQGVKESRHIAHRLMPMVIHDVGLDSALRELVDEICSAGNIKCNYYCNLENRLNEKVEVGLYRVAQEAMSNMLKYAKAEKLSVQLVTFGETVQLMIEDDGEGFDKNEIDIYKSGFGLTGMKNRISALSGSLLIDSSPGHGTTIIAQIPLK